jgi:hypothetical protein
MTDDVQDTFELPVEEMEKLHDIFDKHKNIFYPVEGGTFEQFVGAMAKVGVVTIHDKYEDFISLMGNIVVKDQN